MPRKEIIEAFWKKVRRTPTCWIWVGAKFSHGYGKCHPSYGSQQAHRSAWILTFGKIPRGLFVCHHCDVKDCVNPKHLFLGTNADNRIDALRKGRVRVARGFQLPHTRLSTFEVRRIIQLYSEGLSQSEIARRFSVGQPYVSSLVNGRRRNQCRLA